MYKVDWKFKPFLFVIDSLGKLLFFWTKKKPYPKKVNKVLVVALDRIGDMIMTSPFYQNLKMNYPKAEIHVLCRSITAPILESNKNIDAITEFNPPWFCGKDSDGWKGFLHAVNTLRKEKFDLVFELHADPRNVLLSFLVGGYLVGYGVRGMGFLLNKECEWKKSTIHNVERKLDLLRQLNLKVRKAKLKAPLDRKAKEKMKNMLRLNRINSFYLIHPLSSRQNKDWMLKNWVKLCDRLKGKAIIITGSKEDFGYVSQIKNRTKNHKVYNFAGETNLKELIALVSLADQIITVDTLTVHIAAALNKPQVILYGPEKPEVWGPYGTTKARVIKKHCDCLGKPRCKHKQGYGKCMETVRVEDVLDRLK
jgi:lipopolysaccharide heptosyltransferase II